MTGSAGAESAARPRAAVIIAAGRGRRLMPYTDEMPKCLVPVGGRSIIEWQLAAFAAAGVRDVVIIRGYLGHVIEQRRDALARAAGGAEIRFVDNPGWETNNILASLFCARRELERPVLITYSDIIYTPDVVGALMDARGDLCLVIDRDFRDIYEGRTDHPLSEGEVADLDDAGLVRRVGKRALPPEDAWGEFIGLAKLSVRGAAWITAAWDELCADYAGRPDEPFQRAARFGDAYLTDILQHLIDAGRPLTPVGIRGRWREIDTVQDLDRATALVGCNQEDWK